MADRSRSSPFYGKRFDTVNPDVPLNKGSSDPYSMVTMATMNGENIYDIPVTDNTVTEREDKRDEDVKKSKKPIYLVAILMSAILLMAVVGCFTALFLEVAKLKAETFDESQQTSASPIMLHLQQINGSLQSIENRFQDFIDIQAGKVQQLNNSLTSSVEAILSLHEATASLHNTKVQQLNISVLSTIASIQNTKVNTSLLYSIEEILSTKVQQLNTSVLSKIETIASIQNTKVNTSLLYSIENRFDAALTFQNMNIQQLNSSVNEIITLALIGFNSIRPANSCAALLHTSPSGYYWVRASNGSAVRVYCDMTRSCGGVTGGWMRVTYLDMTNSDHHCPSGFRQRTDSNKRTCGTTSTGCFLFPSSTVTLEYSKVCGKIKAYQIGFIDAFSGSYTFNIDGVIFTYNGSRQHLWTFVAARDEVDSSGICPCINTNHASQNQPPTFVGNDYFCDTGSSAIATSNTFYGDDPLWDGAGCGPQNTCCSFNNPPWFYRQLPQPTTDNIEINVCRDGTDENIAIETVEIYVQ